MRRYQDVAEENRRKWGIRSINAHGHVLSPTKALTRGGSAVTAARAGVSFDLDQRRATALGQKGASPPPGGRFANHATFSLGRRRPSKAASVLEQKKTAVRLKKRTRIFTRLETGEQPASPGAF